MDVELPFRLAGRRVFVAGHRGMTGAALVRRLAHEDCTILTAPRDTLDLRERAAVHAWMARERPDVVILAAARVGGVFANATRPVEFILDNLLIETSVLEAAYHTNVGKLLFLGSSCIYPRLAPQPIREEALLTGSLEPTNEPYAIAKIAGLKLAQAFRREYGRDFISAMPTNLYGPNDNYDPENSHVLPALIRRFHEAKQSQAREVVCWGTGKPLREFLHSDDLARACVFLMQHYSEEQFINVGSGSDISIRELAELVREVTGYPGPIEWDATRPDGTPRKLMDSSRLLALGWRPQIDLPTGIRRAYEDFLTR